MMIGKWFMGWCRMVGFRIKSGILQLSLGIALLISILCASLIGLAYYTRLSFIDKQVGLQLDHRVESGIQYTLAQRLFIPLNETRSIDLFAEGTDSVTVSRKPWGIFELLTSEAHQGRHHAVRAALLAAAPDTLGKAALYMPDNNAPVYLAGDTHIEGTVYASARKFSTGYVDGKGYNRPRFVDGEIRKSEALMPLLDTTLLHAIRVFFKGSPTGYTIDPLPDLPSNRAFPFTGKTTPYYFSNQSIDLSDSLAGNLIIQSAIKIRVTAEARLRDIILIAPNIDIDKGFTGNIQCFAERTLTVGAESYLKYPSALVLLGGERDSTIVIQHDARVQGVVVIPGHDRTLASRGVFKIEKKALFHGSAYVNGASDIQGSLWGQLVTRTTQVRIGETVYGNHLLDATISSVKRSPYMPASPLWNHTKTPVIAQWISYVPGE